MNKKLAEIIVTVLLVAALAIAVVLNVFKKGPSPRKKPLSTTTTAAVTASGSGAPVYAPAGAPVITEAKMNLQKEYALKPWGRDPFQRLKTAEVGYRTSSLELKGISIGADGNGYALINQEIVRVGDKIEGCEVLSIERNRVLLQKGGQSFYLKLPEEEIESPKFNK